MPDHIDRDVLIGLFEKLDDASTQKQILCVIGAAAVLSYGHTARQTHDIDIWRPASSINDRELKKISTAAGIDFDPKELEPNKIYLQVIQPGIVQLPAFSDNKWATGEQSQTLWSGNSLTIIAPPPSIIVAAKLVRAEDRDIDDSIYLIESKNLKTQEIINAISKIPNATNRETAMENLTLLNVIIEQKAPPIKQSGKESPER
jgi:hypothetical protein